MISLAIVGQVMHDITMEKKLETKTKTVDLASMSREELEKYAMEKSLESEALAAKVRHYEEIIRIANSRKYKGSSEKTHPGQLDLGLFNEAELIAEEGQAEEPAIEQVAPKKRTKAKGKKTAWEDTLPTEVIDYTLTEDEQVCPACGGPLHEMTKDVHCEIGIIPAQAKVTKHVTHIYACRNCEKNAESVPIIKAAAPPALIKGSSASASAVAYIIHGKYVMANPLYRLEQELKRLGVFLSRQTMSNWLIKVSQDYLRLLYDLFHELLIARDIAQIDETTLEVIKEVGRTASQDSYMWLYRTGEFDKEAIILFDYEQSRSGDCARAFMEGFSGYFICDGYIGYNKMTKAEDGKPPPPRKRVGCWFHSRRLYDKALRGLKKDETKAITYSERGLEYCNKLFMLEREWKGLPPNKRLEKRKEEALPIVDEYFEWVKKTAAFAIHGSLLSKALEYSISQEEYLRNYLLDGRLPISNNASERSIRSFVIGRVNWMFAFSPNGAEASAVIYSIVETAKANNLNPRAYIEHILTKMPSMDLSDKAALKALLPWSDSIPDNVKAPQEKLQST